MIRSSLLLLAFTLWIAPSKALADEPDTGRAQSVDALRLTLYSGVVVAGRRVMNDPYDVQSRALDPGVRMSARLERPVGRHLSIGGFSEWGGRSSMIDLHCDFGVWVKARHVLDLRSVDLELYLGVPVGPSLLMTARGDTLESLGGLRTGAAAGAQLLFGKAGLFLDVGPSFQAYWSRRRERTRTGWSSPSTSAGFCSSDRRTPVGGHPRTASRG